MGYLKQTGPVIWAGSVALVILAVMILTVALPHVDDWYDDWRAYAHETSFGGDCSGDSPPAQCDDGPPFEAWMLIPWVMGPGLIIALFALALPRGRYLRTYEPEEK